MTACMQELLTVHTAHRVDVFWNPLCGVNCRCNMYMYVL
jgi:hypothetical protein